MICQSFPRHNRSRVDAMALPCGQLDRTAWNESPETLCFRCSHDDSTGRESLHADHPLRHHRHRLPPIQDTLVSIRPGHPDGSLSTLDLNVANVKRYHLLVGKVITVAVVKMINSLMFHKPSIIGFVEETEPTNPSRSFLHSIAPCTSSAILRARANCCCHQRLFDARIDVRAVDLKGQFLAFSTFNSFLRKTVPLVSVSNCTYLFGLKYGRMGRIA